MNMYIGVLAPLQTMSASQNETHIVVETARPPGEQLVTSHTQT